MSKSGYIVVFYMGHIFGKGLGISKVQPNNRITIIRPVQKKLNVNVGDVLMYIEDDKGNILIKKGQVKPV
jgi:hypothetical protein